jgi:hypothetical protein
MAVLPGSPSRACCRLSVAGAVALAAASPAAEGPPAEIAVPPIALPRITSSIDLDGAVSEAAWSEAAVIDRFWETSPGDNLPAKVKTVARVGYDERYFYVGLEMEDPEPAKIRAPFVDRDQVFGTDDNIAVFLDTRNDARTAIEFRVSPRGIQGDAVANDASESFEDFSPDFFYDTAARLTPTGWTAEMRIPLTSLRYPESSAPQTWRILVWRNYPRDYRYAFYSAPAPRGTNCFLCHSHELTGISGLPTSNHLIVAPYATAQRIETREPTSGADFEDGGLDGEGGLDLKWNPTAGTAIDATLNPDFSQIEADVPQISANERFALFFPEKRPFFLEGLDLLQTPIQAVHTRTITRPRWGLRGTGRFADTSYTLLVTEDRGGGLVILPGAGSSRFALQDFDSTAVVGRVRRDFGRSFASFLATAREYSGGGYNRVLGPDFQWRPDESDTVTGQLLWSVTENPDRPEVSSAWRGETSSGHAAHLAWSHQTRGHTWFLRATDVDSGFRADNGFVSRAGYRRGEGNLGWRRYPEKGLVRFAEFYLFARSVWDEGGERVESGLFPGVFFQGRKNLAGTFELQPATEIRVAGALLRQRTAFLFLQVDPGPRFPRVGLNAEFGELIDFDNARVGDGANLSLAATLRPTSHLELLLNAGRRSIDVDDSRRGSGRLFAAHFESLKATYTFSARSLLRLIAQYEETERDPGLYTFAVDRRDGSFLGSILYSYKLNWQTVLFLGYGDDRLLLPSGDLERTGRSLFFKVSYAVQR